MNIIKYSKCHSKVGIGQSSSASSFKGRDDINIVYTPSKIKNKQTKSIYHFMF